MCLKKKTTKDNAFRNFLLKSERLKTKAKVKQRKLNNKFRCYKYFRP